MVRLNKFVFIAVVICCCLGMSNSQAEPLTKKWKVIIGGGVGVGPIYYGSQHYRLSPVPALQISYKGKLFLSFANDMGIKVIEIPNLSLGASVRYNFLKRYEKDKAAFSGLGDLKGSIEVVVFLSYKINDFTVDLDVSQGVNSSGHNGLRLDLKPFYTLALGQKTTLKFGPVLTYANGKYNQKIYGINKNQAAASVFDVYKIGGGFESMGIQGSFLYWIDDHWRIFSYGKYTQFINDVEKSPLLERNWQINAVLGVSYAF